MFFFFSKILAFLLAPYTWIFVGVLILLKKLWHTTYRKYVLTLCVFMYVISNSFLVDEIIRAWEFEDAEIYAKTTQYDMAIVLGGFSRIDERLEKADFNFSGDRLFQTLEMYHKGRVKKLFITGGSGSISHPEHREAIYIEKYLKNIGIPDSNIIIESNSKNTYENAQFSKHILDSLQFKGSILLVTSSFHMRRSLAVFQKAGYKNLTPFVTNKFTGIRKFDIDYCFIPNSDAIFTFNLIIHEMAGYLIYWLKGYL